MLRAKIQEAVCYMEITNFNQLVTRCRIFENKHKEKRTGGSVGPQRTQTFSRGNFGKSKPYSKFSQIKGKKLMAKGSTFKFGGSTVRCFNCGGAHFRNDCPQLQQTQS